jgi:hypothetical protein
MDGFFEKVKSEQILKGIDKVSHKNNQAKDTSNLILLK